MTSVTTATPPVHDCCSTATPPVLVALSDRMQVQLVRRTLTSGGLANPLRVAATAEAATAYLTGDAEYADRSAHPLPAVVVIDLGLPQRSALEVLRVARADDATSRIPVIVVGDTAVDDEVADVHRLGATAYLSRAVLGHALLDVIRGQRMPWTLTPWTAAP